MSYNPHFDFDFSRGQVGEGLAGTFLKALEGSKIEVKTDYRVTETGNVYVEIWQYHKPDESDKKPSGISVTQAEYWVIASPVAAGFICIRTDDLKQLIKQGNYKEVRQPIINENTNASIGRIVPITDIMRKIQLYKGD